MLKFNKVALTVFILVCLLAISHASANDLGVNETVELAGEVPISVDADSIYVDDIEGNDLNDGLSQDTSVKSLDRAISLAKENATIHIASGNYQSDGNVRLTIDKSVSLVGCENTTFDGQNRDHFFTISDGVCVTFKNIKFMWDPSNCWRMREGVSQKTSLDGRTIFFMSYGKWGAMEYFGRLLLLEDFQSYMSDFSGVVIDEEIHIINGRKVPSRLDSVPDSLLGEVIAETYDSRQKIIRWFPDCVALYENGRIRFLYCASREINTVGMWMAKWFFLMQKVMGELSPFCSVHETYIY